MESRKTQWLSSGVASNDLSTQLNAMQCQRLSPVCRQQLPPPRRSDRVLHLHVYGRHHSTPYRHIPGEFTLLYFTDHHKSQ